MQDTCVQSLGQEDSPEKATAAHSSVLAWRIPWTEEPGRLQSIRLHRIGHDWVTNFHFRVWFQGSSCGNTGAFFISMFLPLCALCSDFFWAHPPFMPKPLWTTSANPVSSLWWEVSQEGALATVHWPRQACSPELPGPVWVPLETSPDCQAGVSLSGCNCLLSPNSEGQAVGTDKVNIDVLFEIQNYATHQEQRSIKCPLFLFLVGVHLTFFLRALFYDFLCYRVDKAGLVTDGIYSLPEVAEMCVFLDVGSSYWINSNRKRNGFDWMPIMCQVGYTE